MTRTSQKKQNDTHGTLAIATILALVSFCQKIKHPHLQPKVRQRVLISHIVLTPIIRLGGVDGSWLKKNFDLMNFRTEYVRLQSGRF